jgi:hypothetical protein
MQRERPACRLAFSAHLKTEAVDRVYRCFLRFNACEYLFLSEGVKPLREKGMLTYQRPRK